MKINRQFGDYFVLKRIGVGGMAEIFLGLRRGPGEFEKLYALKAIMGGREKNPTFQHMFQTESEVAARFNHPHVVQLYDVVRIDKLDVMVMEFIPGHTLEEVVQLARERGRELPGDLAVFLLMEVCEGLEYIHTLTDWSGHPLGIVHRDMSPQNIMVTYDGVAKVFDFGIAKLRTRPDNREILGSMVGKLGYMPPEQVRGDAVDARADVFAVGCMLWELTLGRPLFNQKSDIQRINAVMEEPIPRPTEINERYPRLLERIVMRALEKDPAARFGSCAELREELSKYLKLSATKPDRRQAAAFMGGLFAQEIQSFNDDMALARQMAEEKDPTLNIDVHQLMAAVQGQLLEASPGGGVVEMKPTAPAALVAPLPATLAPASAPPAAASPGPEPAPLAPPVVVGVPRGVVLGIVAVAILLIAAAGAVGYIAATRSAAAAPVAAPVKEGSLTLETTPPGAAVTLNGRRLSVQTPVTLPGLELGVTHRVTLELEGHQPAEREVNLSAARAEERVSVTLEAAAPASAPPPAAAHGSVRLTATPREVTVSLDGAQVGTGSPLTLSEIPAGAEHTLRVTAEGFEPVDLTFSVEPGEVKDFEVDLVAEGAAAPPVSGPGAPPRSAPAVSAPAGSVAPPRSVPPATAPPATAPPASAAPPKPSEDDPYPLLK